MPFFSFSQPHHVADPRAIITDPQRNSITFNPRGLNITWGNDKRYWKFTQSHRRNRDINGGVVELLQVAWLEVTGSTTEIEGGKSYRVSFEVSVKPDAFGWEGEGVDVYIMAKIGKKGKFNFQKLKIADPRPQDPGKPFKIPSEQDLVIKLADNNERINNPSASASSAIIASKSKSKLNNKDCRLYFGMYEVWSEKWKGGLRIHRASVEKLAAA